MKKPIAVQISVLMALLLVVITTTNGLCAKAPIGDKAKKAQATLIIVGRVLAVDSKVQKSAAETAIGVHRDVVYTISVEVSSVSKGEGLKGGDRITVMTWKPHTRIPPLPGLQGHDFIPKTGELATFYLIEDGTRYEPLMPNGIESQDEEAE